MVRAIFIGLALVLALIAGAFYYAHTRETVAVVAAQDLTVGTRLTDGHVQLRHAHPGSVPAGAVRTIPAALGRYVTFPVLAGQYVPERALADRPGSAITGGIDIPPGFQVVSIPVSPALAVGGALRPGDHVDVLAVSSSLPGSSTRPAGAVGFPGGGGAGHDLGNAEVIGRHVLVLGLRTEQGAPVEEAATGPRGLNFTSTKIGSLLLAIPPQETPRFSAAAAGATLFVVLDLD